MAEPKTKPTQASVKEFLNQIPDKERRDDCFAVAKIMEEITGDKPKMWGSSIVGFGTYHYKGASGREGDWMITGFSPRKNDLTLYIMAGFEKHTELMKQLGKHSTGKSCLYIKRLSDIHVPTLKKLIKWAVKQLQITKLLKILLVLSKDSSIRRADLEGIADEHLIAVNRRRLRRDAIQCPDPFLCPGPLLHSR